MGNFNIWCDGSYRQQHGTLGAAWIRAVPGGEPQERAMALPKLNGDHNHGSDIAELLAFAYAVGSLPAGSDVRVHMDAQNIIDWLVRGRIGKKPPHALSNAFDEAMEAKNRMGRIEFVKASDKNNENMGRVHALSQKMTTPPKEDRNRPRHAHKNSRRPASPRSS